MAENRRYIKVDEILGVQIQCNCGIAIGGTIKSLASKTAILDRCPACDLSWASGEETESEKRNHTTAVRTFLSQLNTFQKAMAKDGQNYSFTLQIKAEQDEQPRQADRLSSSGPSPVP